MIIIALVTFAVCTVRYRITVSESNEIRWYDLLLHLCGAVLTLIVLMTWWTSHNWFDSFNKFVGIIIASITALVVVAMPLLLADDDV